MMPCRFRSFERIFRSYNAAGFLPILLTVLLVAFALFIPNFVAVQNLLNVLRSSSYLVIIAAGQMLVLIVGGFDLSQGAVVALTSVSSALVMVAVQGHVRQRARPHYPGRRSRRLGMRRDRRAR